MARYISRYAADCRLLRGEKVELVFLDNGKSYPHVVTPSLVAQFRPGLESTAEKIFAVAAFTGRLTHNEDGTVSYGDYLLSPHGQEMRLGGAMPSMNAQDFALPGMTSVMHIDAYDITQKMSTFDTAWHYDTEAGITDWSREDALLAEKLLDRDAGSDYFKVSKTRVRPPWPSYDEAREIQGAHMAIPARVREMGFDPAQVLAYEEQFESPKAGIVKGLTELIEEAAAKAVEDDALQVVVS